jgi:hypothetical protein
MIISLDNRFGEEAFRPLRCERSNKRVTGRDVPFRQDLWIDSLEELDRCSNFGRYFIVHCTLYSIQSSLCLNDISSTSEPFFPLACFVRHLLLAWSDSLLFLAVAHLQARLRQALLTSFATFASMCAPDIKSIFPFSAVPMCLIFAGQP